MKRLESYNDIKFADFNANEQDNVTDWVDVRNCKTLKFYVIGLGDAHSTHVIELQISPDKTDIGKLDEKIEITGTGVKTIDCTCLSYVRCKCTTAQGTPSLVNIWITPFRDR